MARERIRGWRSRDIPESPETITIPDNGTVNPACPCPKTKCKNHGHCEPCRIKHQKSLPYCERKKKTTL